MNKYVKFLLLIFVSIMGAMMFKVTKEYGWILMLFGASLNAVTVLTNKFVMPIYNKGFKKTIQSGQHLLTSDKKKIRLFYLCDIINIPKTKLMVSVGDLILFIGFIILAT